MPAMTHSGLTALLPPDFWPDHCIYVEDKIPLFPGFRGQRCPGNRKVLLAETQEAARAQDSIPDASSYRVKHDIPNVTEFFPLGVFDISPNDFTRPINVCAFIFGS